MKKAILSLFAIAALSTGVFAQQKMSHHRSNQANNVTDHSYDRAYSSPQNSLEPGQFQQSERFDYNRSSSNTYHDYDQAYNPAADRRDMMPSPASVESMSRVRRNEWKPRTRKVRNDAYYMGDFTVYGKHRKGGVAPNPYNGDDAPSYDGAAKNAYRNMNSNKKSVVLPASNGQ